MTDTAAVSEPMAESIRDTSGIGGHPRGLTTLFFTEIWERFSYYGARAILVLYMVAPASTGGLGFDTARATAIYGAYTKLSRARGQEDRRDILGHGELAGRVPSGAIEQQHGVSALGDIAGDLVEVKLHHVGVGV